MTSLYQKLKLPNHTNVIKGRDQVLPLLPDPGPTTVVLRQPCAQSGLVLYPVDILSTVYLAWLQVQQCRVLENSLECNTI